MTPSLSGRAHTGGHPSILRRPVGYHLPPFASSIERIHSVASIRSVQNGWASSVLAVSRLDNAVKRRPIPPANRRWLAFAGMPANSRRRPTDTIDFEKVGQVYRADARVVWKQVCRLENRRAARNVGTFFLIYTAPAEAASQSNAAFDFDLQFSSDSSEERKRSIFMNYNSNSHRSPFLF